MTEELFSKTELQSTFLTLAMLARPFNEAVKLILKYYSDEEMVVDRCVRNQLFFTCITFKKFSLRPKLQRFKSLLEKENPSLYSEWISINEKPVNINEYNSQLHVGADNKPDVSSNVHRSLHENQMGWKFEQTEHYWQFLDDVMKMLNTEDLLQAKFTGKFDLITDALTVIDSLETIYPKPSGQSPIALKNAKAPKSRTKTKEPVSNKDKEFPPNAKNDNWTMCEDCPSGISHIRDLSDFEFDDVLLRKHELEDDSGIVADSLGFANTVLILNMGNFAKAVTPRRRPSISSILLGSAPDDRDFSLAPQSRKNSLSSEKGSSSPSPSPVKGAGFNTPKKNDMKDSFTKQRSMSLSVPKRKGSGTPISSLLTPRSYASEIELKHNDKPQSPYKSTPTGDVSPIPPVSIELACAVSPDPQQPSSSLSQSVEIMTIPSELSSSMSSAPRSSRIRSVISKAKNSKTKQESPSITYMDL